MMTSLKIILEVYMVGKILAKFEVNWTSTYREHYTPPSSPK